MNNTRPQETQDELMTFFLLLLLCWQSSRAALAGSFPLTLQDGAGRQLTLPHSAERVAVLSTAGLEIVLALGGNLVGRPHVPGAAVPEAMRPLPTVGTAVVPNLEQLMRVAPDLIIAPAQAHGDVAERLKVLQTPLYLLQAKSVADVLRTVRDIGALLGREERAAALCRHLEQELAEARATVPRTSPRTLLLFGTSQAFLVIAPQSYAGDLLRLAGGANVATELMEQQSTGWENEGEYLPLSLEALVQAEPEVIYVLSHGDPKAVATSLRKELGSHPAWQGLAGVAVNTFLASLMSLLMLLYSERVPAVLSWMAGSLSGRSWPQVQLLWPYACGAGMLTLFSSRHLNLLLLGEERAAALGLRITQARVFLSALAAVLAAGVVSVGGLIGFVGLIVPHFCRLLVGADHRFLLPASALVGAALVVSADLGARTLFAPLELPVGAVLALLGAPYFLWLLRKGG